MLPRISSSLPALPAASPVTSSLARLPRGQFHSPAALDACEPIARPSRYRGVSEFRVVHQSRHRGSRWLAKMPIQGRVIDLGSYKTEEEAARAVDKANLAYRGREINLLVLSSEQGRCVLLARVHSA